MWVLPGPGKTSLFVQIKLSVHFTHEPFYNLDLIFVSMFTHVRTSMQGSNDMCVYFLHLCPLLS